MSSLKNRVRNTTRSLGVNITRFDPDSSLSHYLYTLLPYLGVNCVLDVGARYGEYGRFLRQNGYTGHIISFEPVKVNFNHLREHCDGDPHWQAYPYALGSKRTTGDINVTSGSDFSSFLEPNEYGEGLAGNVVARTERVKIVRLDEVFDEVTARIPEPRVYLKMDTQGWDLEVFRGAKGCWSKILALQSEISLQPIYKDAPKWIEALAEFNRGGFEVSAMFVVSRDQQLRVIEMDSVMVRASAIHDFPHQTKLGQLMKIPE